jgi:hypothetical protein
VNDENVNCKSWVGNSWRCDYLDQIAAIVMVVQVQLQTKQKLGQISAI